jgi:hypothetical protein
MNDEPMILLLYVDDLFLTKEEKLITECKKNLASKFEMKDLLEYERLCARFTIDNTLVTQP